MGNTLKIRIGFNFEADFNRLTLMAEFRSRGTKQAQVVALEGKFMVRTKINVFHRHHLSFMELGHLLTRSGLTCPEASSKVCHDSFCPSGRVFNYPE
jgi:hypothetical protein